MSSDFGDSSGIVSGDDYLPPSPDVQDNYLLAIVQRDIKAVSRILQAAPLLAGKRHVVGWFPLHAAVLSGDIEVVKLVVARPEVNVNAVDKPIGADVDLRCELGTRVKDTNGATSLHYACMVGNIGIIRLLVDHGAFLKPKDKKKRAPIEYFNVLRDLESVIFFHNLCLEQERREELFKEAHSVDELAQLILKDKIEVFEEIVKKNSYLASQMTSGDFTLLHLAVIRQRSLFVESLISLNKSLVNKRDKRSDLLPRPSDIPFAPPMIPLTHVRNATPLHYACLIQNMDIAEKLLRAGADWNIRDFKGRTPEQLIRSVDGSCDNVKKTFSDLITSEAEKRGMEEEKLKRREKISHANIEDYDEKHSSNWDSDEEDTNMHVDDQVRLPHRVSIRSLLSLEDAIGAKLVGQRGPITLVANAIRLRESGWLDPDRPLTMLFLGSSGVGKTELAKRVALYLHGKNDPGTDKGKIVSKLEEVDGFIRIDMSEFQDEHTYINLIGAPKSYVGHEDGGALTQPLKRNPKAVVLLDEIEKAHPDVLSTFLQVFDYGRITDSKDGTIYCKDAIFIMTSNIAAEEIKDAASVLREGVDRTLAEGRPEHYIHLIQDFTRSIRPQLKYHLKRDEFVGRINQIAVFLPLSEKEIEFAVRHELETWRKRANEKHRIKLSWTNDVVRKLAQSYDVNYGVRSVANEVQRIAVQLVADAYIRGHIQDCWEAELSLNGIGDVAMNAYPGFDPGSEGH